MATMRVERYNYGRRRMGWSCGCLSLLAVSGAMLCLGLYMFSSVWIPVALDLIGVQQVGRTDDQFDPEPPPTVEVQNPQPPPSQVTVNLGPLGTQSLDTRDFTVTTGSSGEGARVATVTFTEASMLDFCHRQSDLCRDGNQQVRDISFDLRPGGVIVNLEANTGAFWQRIGVVLRLDESQRRFRVVGVDLAGTTYAPSALPFGLNDVVGQAIADIEREGNNALTQMALESGGDPYTLESVLIDHGALTIVMR